MPVLILITSQLLKESQNSKNLFCFLHSDKTTIVKARIIPKARDVWVPVLAIPFTDYNLGHLSINVLALSTLFKS